MLVLDFVRNLVGRFDDAVFLWRSVMQGNVMTAMTLLLSVVPKPGNSVWQRMCPNGVASDRRVDTTPSGR